MKKIAFIFIVLLCVATVAFTQISENLNIETFEEEGTSDRGLPYTMTIEFLPATGEAFLTFSISMDIFDQNEAMTAIRDRAQKFIDETKDASGEREYYAYAYRGADTTKYDEVNRTAHHTSRIRFTEVHDVIYEQSN